MARLILLAALIASGAACHETPMYLPPPSANAPPKEDAFGSKPPSSSGGQMKMNCTALPAPMDPDVGNNTFSGMMTASRNAASSVDRELTINPALTQRKERLQWLDDCGGEWFNWRYHALLKVESRLQSAAKAASNSQKAEAAQTTAEVWIKLAEAMGRMRDSVGLDEAKQKLQEPIADLVRNRVDPAVADCLKAESDRATCQDIRRRAQNLTGQ